MNKFIKAFPILIFFLFLLSCTPYTQPTEDINNETSSASRITEETNIYSLLLNQDPKSYIGNSPTIIVFNETEVEEASFSDFSDNELILQRLPGLEEETLLNYRETNRQKQIIQLTLSLKKPYEIIDINEIHKREAEDPEWFRTYTVTTFSAIGFNNTFDQALVYMQHDCGGECSTHDLYFLVRDKNFWKIKDIMEGWVS